MATQEITKAVELIRQTGAITTTKSLARQYAKNAAAALNDLPYGPVRTALLVEARHAADTARDDSYDVIVVGAGPAGWPPPITWPQGRRVLLLEAARYPRQELRRRAYRTRGDQLLTDMGLHDDLNHGPIRFAGRPDPHEGARTP